MHHQAQRPRAKRIPNGGPVQLDMKWVRTALEGFHQESGQAICLHKHAYKMRHSGLEENFGFGNLERLYN